MEIQVVLYKAGMNKSGHISKDKVDRIVQKLSNSLTFCVHFHTHILIYYNVYVCNCNILKA